jgi:plasmid stability protein
MGDLLIRGVPPKTLASLKARAKVHGRSLQAEALEALERAAKPTGEAFVARLQTIRTQNAGVAIDIEAGVRAIREARDER